MKPSTRRPKSQTTSAQENMSKKATVPDAWDDDWEAQADSADGVTEIAGTATRVEEQVKISKAERLARHADENKKLWESA